MQHLPVAEGVSYAGLQLMVQQVIEI